MEYMYNVCSYGDYFMVLLRGTENTAMTIYLPYKLHLVSQSQRHTKI